MGRWPLLAGAFTCGIVGLGASGAAPKKATAGTFERTRRAYSDVDSVHVFARAAIRIQGSDLKPVLGTGTFEYWATGDKYRIRSTTTPNLGLVGDVEYGFDGSRFFYVDVSKGLVSVQSADSEALATALPNPFFAPLEFLSRDDDACPTCALKLKHLKDGGLWSAKLASLFIVQEDGAQTELRSRAASLRREGLDLRTQVKTRASRVESVELLRSDDTVMSSTVIAYRESSDLPKRVTITGFDQGREVAQIDVEIETMTVNEAIAPGEFDAPGRTAMRTWDSDARAYLKAPEEQ